MQKEQPLWYRLYFDPCWTGVVRLVGYAGCLYWDLWEKFKPATEVYGQARVETATAHVLSWEGQFTCNPKPLAEVQLRSEVSKLAWQFLGPPPGTVKRSPHEILAALAKEPTAPEPQTKKKRTRKQPS